MLASNEGSVGFVVRRLRRLLNQRTFVRPRGRVRRDDFTQTPLIEQAA
ncbi:MAG TPA: hypothetical protein PKK40_03605 [Marmoricola sp.]|nr:hypothetical protein [Marmoricola sp.]